MKQVHALNDKGLTKLRQIVQDEDDLIETMVALEYAMDDGCISMVSRSNGEVVYFDNDDFEKVTVM